jgi:hypothetical protein
MAIKSACYCKLPTDNHTKMVFMVENHRLDSIYIVTEKRRFTFLPNSLHKDNFLVLYQYLHH